MGNISTTEQLVEEIRLIELRQLEAEHLFKDDLIIIQDYFKPINLVKNACHDLITTPDLKQKVFSSMLSLLAGYASKKLIFGNKNNIVKDVLGSVLQFGVTKMVSTKSEGILLAISSLIKNFKLVNNTK
jgi:hypothetical protein